VALVVQVQDSAEDVVLSRLFTPDSAAVLGIEIVEDSNLAARKHQVIGRVTGGSCDTSSEAPARLDLIRQAARKRADGVARVTCQKRGASLTRGCLSWIECAGDAIGWP